MKKKTNTPKPEPVSMPAIGSNTLQLLQHILSPLELEALQHPHREFEFKLNDVIIPVSTTVCKQLLMICSIKVHSFSNLLMQAAQQKAAGNKELEELLKNTGQQSAKELKSYAASLAGPPRNWVIAAERNHYMKGVMDGLLKMSLQQV